MNADIQGIQSDLRAAKLDGWLFYDFRGRDPIAQHILNLTDGMRTRRWFYFVPAKGTPKKLVHKIESESLKSLPGDTLYYARQDELRKNLGKMLGRAKNVAMQYSPKNAIPYVAMESRFSANIASPHSSRGRESSQDSFAARPVSRSTRCLPATTSATPFRFCAPASSPALSPAPSPPPFATSFPPEHSVCAVLRARS